MFSLLREKKHLNDSHFNRTLPLAVQTKTLTENFLTLLNEKKKIDNNQTLKQSATIKPNKNRGRHLSIIEKQNNCNQNHRRNISNFTKTEMLNEPEYPIKTGYNSQINATVIKKKDKRQDTLLACEQLTVVKQVQTDEFFDLKYSLKREDYSGINSHYLNNHKSITPTVRSILLDWMMQISKQFNLLRYTFEYAKSMIQMYLSKTVNMKKSRLQLLAVTSLFLGSKLQQFQPKSTYDFSLATDNLYSVQEIEHMQTEICLTLKFKLKSVTHFYWVELFVSKWQAYREKVNCSELDFNERDPNYFDKLYSNILNIINVCCLDVESLQYKPRTLVASLLMLVLGYEHGEFTMDQIQYTFPFSSKYLFSTASSLMTNFGKFLKSSFSIHNLVQLLPSLQFASSYFFVYSSKQLVEKDKQSHNRNGLVCVQKRQQFVAQHAYFN